MPRKKNVARMSVDELTRLAFVYGEQDVRGLAEAYGAETPERKQYEDLANAMRKYRVRRWGRTTFEALTETAELKTMTEIKSMYTTTGPQAERES